MDDTQTEIEILEQEREDIFREISIKEMEVMALESNYQKVEQRLHELRQAIADNEE